MSFQASLKSLTCSFFCIIFCPVLVTVGVLRVLLLLLYVLDHVSGSHRSPCTFQKSVSVMVKHLSIFFTVQKFVAVLNHLYNNYVFCFCLFLFVRIHLLLPFLLLLPVKHAGDSARLSCCRNVGVTFSPLSPRPSPFSSPVLRGESPRAISTSATRLSVITKSTLRCQKFYPNQKNKKRKGKVLLLLFL